MHQTIAYWIFIVNALGMICISGIATFSGASDASIERAMLSAIAWGVLACAVKTGRQTK